jgi:citrate synthase
MLNEQILQLTRGFRRDAHPMAVMIAIVGALSAFYYEDLDVEDPHKADDRDAPADRQGADHRGDGLQVLGRPADPVPAQRPRLRLELPAHDVRGAVRALQDQPGDGEGARPDLHPPRRPRAERLDLDRAARGLDRASPYAAIAAGIASLWGPAHGGANEAVLSMLREIGSPSRVGDYIAKVKDKDSGVRLMGFGHRVYKNYDPRAGVLKESADQVLQELGHRDNPLLDIARELEKIALSDDYFVQRKLFPNVDFYSGLILEAMGIPTRMFTAIFALARTVGWIAQWNEMIEDPEQKIGRPRQLYVGAGPRPFVPVEQRG